MIAPLIPTNENKRLEQLHSFDILDTLPEEDYDQLTFLASKICGTSISLVSLVDKDRQWFKSNHGLNAKETKRTYSFCAHAINNPKDLFIVENTAEDERFHDNPLVTGHPNIGFYAGMPLVTEEGLPLGTLCVIDNKPKTLTRDQIASLKIIANQVMRLLELRRDRIRREQAMARLELRNKEVEELSSIASHDLKEPLQTISGYLGLINDEYHKSIPEELIQHLNAIERASSRMHLLIKTFLDYSRLGMAAESSQVDCNELIKIVSEDLNKRIKTEKATIRVNKLPTILAYRTELRILFQNLISNAIKFRKPDVDPIIVIDCESENNIYHFRVTDNGIGIEKENLTRVFKMFQQVDGDYKKKGHGIGLANCKKIVELHEGSMWVESTVGIGSTFHFSISKRLI